jgi:hypothetical protein
MAELVREDADAAVLRLDGAVVTDPVLAAGRTGSRAADAQASEGNDRAVDRGAAASREAGVGARAMAPDGVGASAPPPVSSPSPAWTDWK